MVDNQFFEESREQSQIKARIVAKYFWAWANVIIGATRAQTHIAYVDLFSGPGRYEDGTLSTPLLVLKRAIEDPTMHGILLTFFNDKDAANVERLKKAITGLPRIATLKHEPEIFNEEVNEELAERLAKQNFPILLFLDPWGYKGLSLGLINSVLKNWGCDCVFFFNYNRVNMGLSNSAVKSHMNVLFGEDRANGLRKKIAALRPFERENAIIGALSESLQEMGAEFVLPFRFRDAESRRTTHHLVFTTKHFKGYEIMRDIMGKESSEENQGVPSFEHSPQAERWVKLFQSTPVDDLAETLLHDLAGQKLTVRQIFEHHSVGLLYLERNYKSALASLEKSRRIITSPPADKRPVRKGEATFANHVQVTFPKRKS